jgi:YD repeat-containing protein
MATRSKKVLKTLAETLGNDGSKKKTSSGYNKDGSPKIWPKQPVFKDESEKQCFLDQLKAATTGKDWAGVCTLGEDGDRIVYKVTYDENGQLAFIRDNDAPESAVECQEAEKSEDAGFILPMPTAKLEENDIPEYVLNAFMQPGAEFKLESTVTIGKEVRIVYRRDPEYFEAIITIGAQRALNRCIEINSLVIKDGATYAVDGKFCDHPEFDNAIALNQPRVIKLYNFLCEKLGLN